MAVTQQSGREEGRGGEGALLTVLADIQLPEVGEVGDRRGQHSQVIIGHAQPIEQLTVEQLLWKKRETEDRKGLTAVYFGKTSHLPLRVNVLLLAPFFHTSPTLTHTHTSVSDKGNGQESS